MLQNLRAEMLRYGITAADLSRAAKRTERSIRLKVAGKTAFTLPEGIAIRDAFFPGMSLEYLFARICTGQRLTVAGLSSLGLDTGQTNA